MTGRDLIKWILDNKAEDLPVEIQYRDDSGDSYGTDSFLRLEISLSEYMDENGCESTYERIVL